MANGVAALVWVVIMVVGGLLSFGLAQASQIVGGMVMVITVLVASVVAAALKLAAQWEKGVVFRLGKYQGLRGPGMFFIVQVIDTVRMIDTRVLTTDIPKQQVITKDNVPVSINGVLYFRVAKPEDAVIKVQDYAYAISQYAQTALRDIVGGMTLDDLLTEREQIGKAVEAIVEKESQQWGLEVTGIRLQDIDRPEDLKKMMSRQASAEREKRATITKAGGDKLAAMNLADAARTMLASPGRCSSGPSSRLTDWGLQPRTPWFWRCLWRLWKQCVTTTGSCSQTNRCPLPFRRAEVAVRQQDSDINGVRKLRARLRADQRSTAERQPKRAACNRAWDATWRPLVTEREKQSRSRRPCRRGPSCLRVRPGQDSAERPYRRRSESPL